MAVIVRERRDDDAERLLRIVERVLAATDAAGVIPATRGSPNLHR